MKLEERVKTITSFLLGINRRIVSNRKSLNSWASLMAIISFVFILPGLIVAYFQIRDYINAPEVELELLSPQSILYSVNNISRKTAENILVSFGIFDLDGNISNPLPLKSFPIDYINSGSSRGPWKLLGNLSIFSHRYFGIIYLSCKGCRDLKTYWIYFREGDERVNFFTKRDENDTFEINVSRLKDETDLYLDNLVPRNRRIYILDK